MSKNVSRKASDSKTKSGPCKPLPTKPVKNSILLLEKKLLSTQADLEAAKSEDGRSDNFSAALARNRIVNSPQTNLKFRQTVARKVDFKGGEHIFSHLASLSIHEDEDEERKKKTKHFTRPSVAQDEEPRLEDFHRPFEGEETSAISDIYSIQNLVSGILDSLLPRSPTYTTQQALFPNFFKK